MKLRSKKSWRVVLFVKAYPNYRQGPIYVRSYENALQCRNRREAYRRAALYCASAPNKRWIAVVYPRWVNAPDCFAIWGLGPSDIF